MLSRREYEKKLREEQEATAHVFQDFISTFQDVAAPPNKTFVKSGLLYPEAGKTIKETGSEVYNPKPVIKAKDTMIKNAIECARILKHNKGEKPKKQVKPTSNLELLKEELKMRHFERDEKNKGKDDGMMSDNFFYEGDPNSTNLFVANLSQKITENDLMKLFGTYGPLASVKIMWPRGEERFRNTNCGFVAFMSRKDAERALNHLKHRSDMRVGWGKCVDIPMHPIYIPQSLLKLYLPPPYTGLPFNAQPLDPNYTMPATEEEMQQLLQSSVIKVTLPLDKKILMLVHRVIEFVIREGPLFEAYIMNKEINNPDYTFLFDYKSPIHTYYRWKLYSIKMGQSQKNWSCEPFRMFKGGSIWIPPIAPNYINGMPDELFTNAGKMDKCTLSDAQSQRLVHLIRNLTISKISIAEAMIFCLNHSEAIGDSICIIIDSLLSTLNPLKKISRLYLLSDVLCNCLARKVRIDIETLAVEKLITVFQHVRLVYDTLKATYDKDAFKTRILKLLRAWDVWKLFPVDIVNQMESTVLEMNELDDLDDDNSSTDEPLDGASLIKRSMKNNSDCHLTSNNLKTDSNTIRLENFVPSKWDTIDPVEVEAQAMSTSKLYELEVRKEEEAPQINLSEKKCARRGGSKVKDKNKKDSRSGRKDGEAESRVDIQSVKCGKQAKRIAHLVRKYQEDLENGVKEVKKGYSIKELVGRYRKHLIRDFENKDKY